MPLVIWSLFIGFPLTNLTYYSEVLDTISSLPLGTICFVNYFYFWLSSWWVVTLYLFLLWYTIYYTQPTPPSTLYCIPLFLLVMVDPMGDLYWASNTSMYLVDDSMNFGNILLMNPINRYHPGFALALVIFIYFTFHLLTSRTRLVYTRYKLSLLDIVLKRYTLRLLLIAFSTLFTGAWWALQEGSWGGWWNWDITECFSLLLLLAYISQMHTRNIRINNLLANSSLIFTIYAVLIVKLLVQYSLITTNHSFSSEFSRGIIVSKHHTLSTLLICIIWYITLLSRLYNQHIFYTWSLSSNNYLSTRLQKPTYISWAYISYAILTYVTIQGFSKDLFASLDFFTGLATSLYTLPWKVQVRSTLVFLLFYVWGFYIGFVLIHLYYVYAPTIFILLLTSKLLYTKWKAYGHIFTRILILLTILYIPFTLQVYPNTFSGPASLNYALIQSKQVLLIPSFEVSFCYINSLNLQSSGIQTLFTCFQSGTGSSLESPRANSLPSFNEQQSYLSTVYRTSIIRGLEVVSTLLGTSSIWFMLNALLYLYKPIKLNN